MSIHEAKADVFWLAFKALPRGERQSVIERLLKDKEFREDLIDLAVFEQREKEPSRPLKDYLREKGKAA